MRESPIPIPMTGVAPSPTADSRTCDPTTVSLEQLRQSSVQHIADVSLGLHALSMALDRKGVAHDRDKVSPEGLAWFHRCFVSGFHEDRTWLDNHYRTTRHHLTAPDGVPDDVDLLDVLEYIVDCVVAGKARSGAVYDLTLPDDVLRRAMANTVQRFTDSVMVVK